MANAYTRAERCFAVARSTKFPAERAAAIGRGTAIANAAGINLDRFDIPGRVNRNRSADFRATRADFSTARHAPADYSVDEVNRLFREHLHRMGNASARDRNEMREALDRMGDAIGAAEQAAGAVEGETAYDARRRNFDAACAAAKARDARAASGAAL